MDKIKAIMLSYNNGFLASYKTMFDEVLDELMYVGCRITYNYCSKCYDQICTEKHINDELILSSFDNIKQIKSINILNQYPFMTYYNYVHEDYAADWWKDYYIQNVYNYVLDELIKKGNKVVYTLAYEHGKYACFDCYDEICSYDHTQNLIEEQTRIISFKDF